MGSKNAETKMPVIVAEGHRSLLAASAQLNYYFNSLSIANIAFDTLQGVWCL